MSLTPQNPIVHDQDLLDEALAESFPASDPISPYIRRAATVATTTQGTAIAEAPPA